jgi:hypothetical protein
MQELYVGDGNRFGCCTKDLDEAVDPIPANSSSALEALSYEAIRFQEESTVDVERSHARYSKIVVHSTRARTQRKPKAWEDWLRGATAGRGITLIQGLNSPRGVQERDVQPKPPTAAPAEHPEAGDGSMSKTPATYYLDGDLTRLTIQPQCQDADKRNIITLVVDNIQVICPAMDFMAFCDQMEDKLSDSEKSRAVLLQYITEDTEKRRLCFVVETEAEKDQFVQALTALWLEKRNDHSMWF